MVDGDVKRDWRIGRGLDPAKKHGTGPPKGFEARIMAGEDVSAVEIARARDRLPNGRPLQSRSSARLAA
jgi:hypothetical protein